MSFRSRSRTTQPVVRHRSLSSSRVPTSSSTSSSSYLNSSPSTYTPNRPLTVSYSVTPNTYSSRENLYSPTKRSNFFSTGNNNSTTNTSSPYTHRKDAYNNNSSSSSYKSPYADRYVSPYSSYDNGVTTAGLNLSAYTSGNSYKTNSSFNHKPQLSSAANNYGTKNMTNSYGGNSTKTYKRDYTTPPRSISSLLSSKRFSSSNNSLNTYIPSSSTISASIGRSQSFKNDDHNTRRSNNKSGSKANRSNSISSEKSEGYEVRFIFWPRICFFFFLDI